MSTALNQSFSGRTVFLTGHTGFKGSWLALWLKELGAKVVGYSLQPPTIPNNFAVSNVRDCLAAHHEADIRDSSRLSDAIRRSAPDVIFHIAAQPIVRESYKNPRETFDVNVMGTISLLESIREAKKPCVVVIVTSDKCYENREQVSGYRESDAMGGFDPYSASKGAAEIATACYRRSFFSPDHVKVHGIKIASARAGNVIGGGDWAKDRIIPDAVTSLSQNKVISIRNPKAIRPWQHVLEPLSGYLTLAARLLASDDPNLCTGWNFGPHLGDEAPVATLIQTFCKAWGSGTWRDDSNPQQVHEAAILRLSIDKAMNELNWKPRWKLEQTIAQTARWYHRFYHDQLPSMRDECLKDIAEYSSAQVERTV